MGGPTKSIDTKLDFWIKNKRNVLFIGKHGVGKTSMVVNAFQRHNKNFLYFSASTMDPWVDFIGVPKEQRDENGQPYLDLVRPKAFRDDSIQALFFDEFNRSPKKVRNAVMELIQFKSINGRKFVNLEFVWAAINPKDDKAKLQYDVEDLDPAQVDRFQIHCDIPYQPVHSYFKEKYNEEIAAAAIEWWRGLSAEHKDETSPRRLDYLIEEHLLGGDVRNYVVSEKTNVSKLLAAIDNGSYLKKFKTILGQPPEAIRSYLKDENNFAAVQQYIIEDPKIMRQAFPHLAAERQSKMFSDRIDVQKYVLENPDLYKDLLETLSNFNSPTKSFIKNKIKVALNPANRKSASQTLVEESDKKEIKFELPLTLSSATKKIAEDVIGLVKLNDQFVHPQPAVDNTYGVKEYQTDLKKTYELIEQTRTTNPNQKWDVLSGLVQEVLLSTPQYYRALYILKTLEYIASKTQEGTLYNNRKNFIPLINTCISSIVNYKKTAKNKIDTFDETQALIDTILHEHQNLTAKFVRKIVKDPNTKKKSFILSAT